MSSRQDQGRDQSRMHPGTAAGGTPTANHYPIDSGIDGRQIDRDSGGGYRGQQGGYDGAQGYGNPPGGHGQAGGRDYGAMAGHSGAGGIGRFGDWRDSHGGSARPGDWGASPSAAAADWGHYGEAARHSRESAEAAWPGAGPGSNPGTGGDATFGQHQQHDPDYHQWRDEQLRGMDEEYEAWRQERYRRFSDEFGEWRRKRESGASSGASGSNSGTSATSIGGGTGGAGSSGTSDGG